ncbi:MAG: hypothetical protein CL842_00265 [Crocinitomicaceae bacterium]|nr:hypothetical protein [Crocinitomicaceae bacterium]|tara:strand:+ start:294396 stop:294908 length:513 start_codon:yes stop_codon:yes gene_type:complete
MKLLSFILLYGFVVVLNSDKYNDYQTGNSVSKNGMEVSWEFNKDSVTFEMSAPTNGWVTVGFNSNEGMAGCYLLMGRIENDTVQVVEHYTQRPGEYAPISKYDVKPKVSSTSGFENGKMTKIKFSILQKAISKYQKDLFPNSDYVTVLAYSESDDFQHHSSMRTSVKVTL